MATSETEYSQLPSAAKSLIVKIADRYFVGPERLLKTLKDTAFRQPDGADITNEQMMALLVVADQYQLNPFLKEIYAFQDRNSGIVPIVGIDGWLRIINSHSSFDGMEITYSENHVKLEGMKVECPEWIDVTIYRKDRNRPVTIREYLDEVYRPPYKGVSKGKPYTSDGSWQKYPKRMLRHRGIIQCARVALGFADIRHQDDTDEIIDMGEAVVVNSSHGSQSDTPLQIDHKSIDSQLAHLIDRVRENNAWQVAHDYIKSRFSGPEFAYAHQKLNEAEKKIIDEKLRAADVNIPQPEPEVVTQPQQASIDDEFVAAMEHQEDLMHTAEEENQSLHF